MHVNPKGVLFPYVSPLLSAHDASVTAGKPAAGLSYVGQGSEDWEFTGPWMAPRVAAVVTVDCPWPVAAYSQARASTHGSL